MRLLLKLLTAVVFCVTAASTHAAAEHTKAQLILAAESARAGDSVLAGLHLRMDPEWHVYWKNPGASGIPTSLDWQLPAGITAGEIQWPVPEKIPPDDLATYAYHDETVLLVPLKLAPDLQPGSYELKASAAWLECRELCLPGSAEVSALLIVGGESKPSTHAALIETYQKKLPHPGDAVSARAFWENTDSGNSRVLILEWAAPKPAGEPDFYPDVSSQIEVEGETRRTTNPDGSVRLLKKVRKLEGDWPGKISGLLVEQSDKERIGYEVTLPIAEAASSPVSGGELLKMLLFAFVGGLILNIMPCVLPVIALKILGFVSEARSDPGHVRKLGLVYTVGVLVSFLALAGLIIGVKAAGMKAGWGMQFGNVQFLVALTILIMLVAMNLFGVFEIGLGGNVMGAAGNLASRSGSAGAFFNGVLATVLATPCTAPFLGVALGFAFAQNTATIVMVFLAIGIGLALPYLILSWNPAWLKFLPKPGAWMERFKILMGFPMLAAGVWLFTLAAGGLGKTGTLWFGLFLVALAMAAWIWGEFVQRGSHRKGLAIAASVLLVGASGLYAFAQGPDQIDWQPWSPAAVEKARAESRPVFVDFTADWCLTCKANKKFAIEIPSVRARLKSINAVTLMGDYTKLPDDITDELNRFGRAGVPLVLVYPKDRQADPIVLPEALTPGIVLEALDKAAK